MKSAIDPKLLEILVCPLTKTRLIHDKKNNQLISEVAGLAYPIQDGIPIMLVDEAKIIDESKATKYQHFFNKHDV